MPEHSTLQKLDARFDEVVVYCDGGTKEHGEQIAYAAVVGDKDGQILVEQARNGVDGTSNQAEYMGLILGAELAHLVGAGVAHFFLDSQLVVEQVGGWWAINNNPLAKLHARANALLMRLDSFTIKHVPRGQNRRADWLVCRELGHQRTLKTPPEASLVFSTEGRQRSGWTGI